MNEYITDLEREMIKQALANAGRVKIDLSNDLHYAFFLEQNGGLDRMARVAPTYLSMAQQQRRSFLDGIFLEETPAQSVLGLVDYEYISNAAILQIQTETGKPAWNIFSNSIATYIAPRAMEKMTPKISNCNTGKLIYSDTVYFDTPDSDHQYVSKAKKIFPLAEGRNETEYRATTYFENISVNSKGEGRINGTFIVSSIFTYNTSDDIERITVNSPQPINGNKRTGEDAKIVHISYSSQVMKNPDYTYKIYLPSDIKEMPVRIPLEIEVELRNGSCFYSEGEKGYLDEDCDPTVILSRFYQNKVIQSGAAPLIIDWKDFSENNIKIIKTDKNNNPIALRLTFPEEWKSKLLSDAVVTQTTDADLYMSLMLNMKTPKYGNVYVALLIGSDMEPTHPGTNTAYMPRLRYAWDCFDKNALISTVNGQKRAVEINKGDQILTRNGKTAKVINIVRCPRNTMLSVKTENGGLLVTPSHIICTDKGCCPASLLVPGNNVRAWNEKTNKEFLTKVTSVTAEEYEGDAYNFQFDSTTEIIANGLFVGDALMEQNISRQTEEIVRPTYSHELQSVLSEIKKLCK
ncbi:hypothetical protein ABGM91_07530 [Akkermansia muciniphila]|uniref:hypothetical protein n=1 Tax=Akkermansia muciniphila TaxID=239935 RepID=UPI0033AC0657